MTRARKIVGAMGVVSCAISVGLAVQITMASSAEERTAGAGMASGSRVLSLADITLVGALQSPPIDDSETTPTAPVYLLDVTLRPSVRTVPTKPMLPEGSCTITSRATPLVGALVRLEARADCLPEAPVTVRHDGMLFAETTDSDGRMDFVVPALAQHAMFELTFAGGDVSIAETSVPDIGGYNRVVLQWQGDAGFELHAREFGADYGDPGHVWRGAVANENRLRDGNGGVLVTLGNPRAETSSVAEVYTYPAHLSRGHGGQVGLSVEAEVTDRNCGREIEAQIIELGDGGLLTRRDLAFTVPACDSVGGYLVLNNVLEDLKIAAR